MGTFPVQLQENAVIEDLFYCMEVNFLLDCQFLFKFGETEVRAESEDEM